MSLFSHPYDVIKSRDWWTERVSKAVHRIVVEDAPSRVAIKLERLPVGQWVGMVVTEINGRITYHVSHAPTLSDLLTHLAESDANIFAYRCLGMAEAKYLSLVGLHTLHDDDIADPDDD
jgi:hypothetical protein